MNTSSARSRLVTFFFGLTIALSAFLLFQIQPVIGKFILPWFGGSSAVWTTSMLFFQALLLGGYAYAHWLGALAPRRQGRLHLLVLGGVLLWVILSALARGTPVTPSPAWQPAGGAPPAGQILWVLGASVGIPYLLLSTTSSLLQAWYREVQRRSSPYAFYALSNAASLLALVSYPLLFEPALTLNQQAVFWSAGFFLYLIFAAGCALLLRRAHAAAPAMIAAADPVPVIDDPPGELDTAEPPARPTWRAALYWVALAACSSTLLLATTNHITQDLTSAPFLWVLPLSLYLLSFVIAFNDRQVRLRGVYVLLVLAVLFVGYLVLKEGSSMPILQQLAGNAVLLFVICLLCHTELYARRPHPRYLTTFYLMVSVGGAAGGLFVSLIAPLIFRDFWEYHLGLAGAAAVAVAVAFGSRGSWIHRLRFPVALGALALSGLIISTTVYWISSSVLMTRSFYGVLRVRGDAVDGNSGYKLMNGGIMHGSQITGKPYRYRPTTYYTASTGVGLAYRHHPRYLSGQPMRIGVIGLGVGTMAAYGRPGDIIRFYEINPDVERLARDARYFTYLADSQAQVEVVLGDARLSMERELRENGPQGYDLLVIDAFSGDSIPTHLIDKEAVALYLEHLAPGGILAFHISNRHIDLQPVVALLAKEYSLDAALIEGGGQDWHGSYSVWALLGSQAAIHGNADIAAPAKSLKVWPGLRIWTDDYSNLVQVLRILAPK